MLNRTLFKGWLWLLIVAASTGSAYGQAAQKHDLIVKTSGEQLTGDVLEVSDSTVRFSYTGEKVVYTLRKSDIEKITFASGRTEHFAPAASSATGAGQSGNSAPSAAQDRRNKVAILPFAFIRDGQSGPPELSEEIQNECYAMLSKHSGVYTVVSPRSTNVLLAKAGITRANVMNYSMAEIGQILGVEYVIDGMVTQNRTNQTSYGSSTYNDRSKGNKDSDKRSGSGSSSSYSTTTQNYQTVMDLKIYNDKSEVVYSQNRKAFWNTQDAYKNTMEYLIKRSPLYTK